MKLHHLLERDISDYRSGDEYDPRSPYYDSRVFRKPSRASEPHDDFDYDAADEARREARIKKREAQIYTDEKHGRVEGSNPWIDTYEVTAATRADAERKESAKRRMVYRVLSSEIEDLPDGRAILRMTYNF